MPLAQRDNHHGGTRNPRRVSIRDGPMRLDALEAAVC